MKAAFWIAILVAIIVIVCTMWVVGTETEVSNEEQQQQEINAENRAAEGTPVIIDEQP